MFEANYPESTNRIFLIHCKHAIRSGRMTVVYVVYMILVSLGSLVNIVPSFFRRGYDLVKGFMDETTQSKMMFLGSELTSETLYIAK